MNKPLEGVIVLDLSRILAGPWATQCLADYGAEVWKIEHPLKGDDTRHWGPPFLTSGNYSKPSEAEYDDAAYFLSANRNKKSICIDFSQSEGHELIIKLAKKADILVENYKVDGLKKYGLHYDELKKINPQLIYASITGFGQTGPNADKPGYDAMIQASAGLMSITGKPDDEVGGGPVKVGVAVADLMTGMYTVNSVLAALLQRGKTRLGQHLDICLYDTQLAWLANQNMNYLVGGMEPQRLGSAHPNIVPYQAFAASDGYLMLAVGNDQQFQRCCKVLGVEDMANDPRFTTNGLRVEYRHELVPILQQAFLRKGREEWLAELEKAKVPCGPINTVKQAIESPQSRARHLVQEVTNANKQKISMISHPVKFSDSMIEYKAPPLLGEHTEQVLSEELELNMQELSRLSQKNVIKMM